MSDKENELNNINQSEEFQTFHKNIKDSNINSNKGKNSNSQESNEFTFKKNLFNKNNMKSQDNNQIGHFIQEYNENNINSKSMLFHDINNYIENKNILRVLFQKDKNTINDKIFNTVIINNYNSKGKKLPNNKSNKKYNNSFLKPKIKKNIKNNEKYKSNNVIYNDMKKKTKSPLINKNSFKSKTINNSKKTSIKNQKNKSFISQKNKLKLNQNDFISSYKTKIKKIISSKSINTITENNKINYNGKGIKNNKISNQKMITYNSINKEQKGKEKNILKKCNKGKIQLTKKDNSLTLNNNYKIINKNKLEKTPLSCKNQVNNFYIKEYTNKNYQIKSNPVITLKKKNNVSNNKTNSSILIKKNRTFLNLNNKNKQSSLIKGKNETKVNKKLTPDKKNVFTSFNKKK